jgi:hypothetical protein
MQGIADSHNRWQIYTHHELAPLRAAVEKLPAVQIK